MSSLSRIERFGTIFTRIRDLMRAGVLKEEDRPLWYDTMKHFPPIEPPSHEREIPSEPIREILYPEDVVRAKFYKTYGTVQPLDLSNHSNIQRTPCFRFMTKYQELEKTWTGSDDELFEATARAVSEQGLVLKKRGEGRGQRVGRSWKYEEDNLKGENSEEGPIISKESIAGLVKQVTDAEPEKR